MPPRNVITILIVLGVSLICYATATRNRYANVIAEALDVVSTNALEEVDQRQLFISAMQGMLQELDDNSMFLADEFYRKMNEDIEQKFGGVGLEVRIDPDTQRIMVSRPLPGTPGQRAGLLAGDVILEIDGQSTEGMTTVDAVAVIRGPVGTSVRLGIQRPPSEKFEVELERSNIQVPSVYGDTRNDDGSWNFVLESHPQIGYLRLTKFGMLSTEEMQQALAAIENRIDGLILDLRYNHGGIMDGAIDVSDLFLPGGKKIVSTRGRGGRVLEQFYSSDQISLDLDVPVAVLINRSSASASEIVASALQDHGRAVVIGERSYGKGTVQNLIPVEQGRSFIKLTVATYWRPSDRNIDRTLHEIPYTQSEGDWGVQPSDGYACDMTREQVEMIEIARLLRDNGEGAGQVSRSRPDPPGPGDDAPNSQNQPATDQEDSVDNDETTDGSLPLPDSVPEWESIDLPLQQAIQYIQNQVRARSAA